MPEVPTPPAGPPFLRTPRSRRAFLGGTVALAAAGTAVAVGTATQYSGSSRAPAAPDPSPQATAGVIAPAPIDDPKRRAAHLLRRAGFGGTLAEIEAFATLSREAAADSLLNYETVDNSALDARLATRNFDVTNHTEAVRWWLTRMAYSARPLEERMTLFWHGLLTSQVSKVEYSRRMVEQNGLFRALALGRCDDLIQAVSKNPAMMFYLDTVESSKAHPNENFARELMELFTLGVGNYSEQDVRESARAFTGWRYTNPKPTGDKEADRKAQQLWDPEFYVVAAAHDALPKTFLGRTGPFGGEEIIAIIMDEPATGRFLTGRLFKAFANAAPTPDMADHLAGVWNTTGHQIKAVLREILISDDFYSETSYRASVRNPIEFLVGAVRGLQLETDFAGADRALATMGQLPFEPPNVAGWPGGPAWMSTGTFFARINFLDQFLFPRGKPLPIPALASAASADTAVDTALACLVDDNMPDGSVAVIREAVAASADPSRRVALAAQLVLASPEFQLI